MAVDTAAKRASAISAFIGGFGMHPPSTGGINTANERKAVAYAYAYAGLGNEVTSPLTDRRRRTMMGVPFGLPAGGIEILWPSLS